MQGCMYVTLVILSYTRYFCKWYENFKTILTTFEFLRNCINKKYGRYKIVLRIFSRNPGILLYFATFDDISQNRPPRRRWFAKNLDVFWSFSFTKKLPKKRKLLSNLMTFPVMMEELELQIADLAVSFLHLQFTNRDVSVMKKYCTFMSISFG